MASTQRHQIRERVLSNSEIRCLEEFNEADYLRGRALMMILLTASVPAKSYTCALSTSRRLVTSPAHRFPALGWLGTKNAESHRVWLPAPAQKILTEMETTDLCSQGRAQADRQA